MNLENSFLSFNSEVIPFVNLVRKLDSKLGNSIVVTKGYLVGA